MARGAHIGRRERGDRSAQVDISLARGPARFDVSLARGPARFDARAKRLRERGLTLIEIMIVVVIVALAATGASLGVGVLTRTGLRSACIRLIGMSRVAYHRALTHGTTVRLTLNMKNGNAGLSEAHGRVTLVRSDAPLRKEGIHDAQQEEDDEDADPGAAVDPWAAAKARVDQPLELTFPPSPFAPLTTASGAPMKRFEMGPLAKGVRIIKLIVAHEAEPRTAGKADLFFFSSGLTQHAVVQLQDRSDTIYSVEIHPLTGAATVHDVPYEPEVLMDDPSLRDDEASQLEESL